MRKGRNEIGRHYKNSVSDRVKPCEPCEPCFRFSDNPVRKAGGYMKELSERVLKIETTVQTHIEHDDRAFAAINDRITHSDAKLDNLHREMTDGFNRITDILLKGKL